MSSISNWPLFNRAAFAFIVATAAIRLYVASSFELGVDEAHYLLYGHFIALSYFDHPPLVGWIHYLFQSLFGNSIQSARLPAILIGALVSWQVYRYIGTLSSQYHGFLAMLCINAIAMFNALFLMFLPETLLLALIIPTLKQATLIFTTNRLSSWLLLALYAGLAGLSKYTAIIIFIAILLFFILHQRWRLLFSWKMMLFLTLGLLMITPVIIWNIQHDWVSFTYQANHVTAGSHYHITSFLQSIAAQSIAYFPPFFLLAYWRIRYYNNSNLRANLAIFIAVTMLLFFHVNAFKHVALPHWSAVAYFLLIIHLFDKSNNKFYSSNKVMLISLITSALITMLLLVELAFKVIPFPDYASPHRDIYGMKQAVSFAKSIQQPNETLATINWTLASRVMYYAMQQNLPFALLDKRFDQFDIWHANAQVSHNYLIISTHFFHDDISKLMQCKSIKNVGDLPIMLGQHRVNTIYFTRCTQYERMR